jgi:hypothetical protein
VEYTFNKLAKLLSKKYWGVEKSISVEKIVFIKHTQNFQKQQKV